MNRPDHSIFSLAVRYLKRFSRKESGVISVEAVMIYPLLFWGMCASYTFFDGYKQSSRNLKASYAIADVISRERNDINATYMDTLYDLLQAYATARWHWRFLPRHKLLLRGEVGYTAATMDQMEADEELDLP